MFYRLSDNKPLSELLLVYVYRNNYHGNVDKSTVIFNTGNTFTNAVEVVENFPSRNVLNPTHFVGMGLLFFNLLLNPDVNNNLTLKGDKPFNAHLLTKLTEAYMLRKLLIC